MENEQKPLQFLIENQKDLANYKKKSELGDALRIIRYTRGLRAPKGVQDFLDWVAHMNGNADEKNGVGCFFHCYQTIAKQMNCSIRKVEDAIQWLKNRALMQVIQFEETYYKVFSDIETITIMVNALVEHRKSSFNKKVDRIKEKQEINEIVRKYVGPHVGPYVGLYVDNKRPYIKDLNKKPISNNNNTPPRCEGGDKSPDINLKNFNPKIKDFLTQHEQFYEYPLWSLNQQEKLIYWSSEAFKKSKADIENEKHQHALITVLRSVQNWYDLEDEATDDYLTKYFYRKVYNALKKAVKGESPSSQKPNKSNKRKKPTRTELVPDWFDRDTEQKELKDKQSEEASKNIDLEKSRKEIDIMNALIDEPDEQKKMVLQSELDALKNGQVIISETAKAEMKNIRAILDGKAPLPIGAIIIPSSGNESIQTI